MVSEGDRIELIETSDPYTDLEPGEEGTVDDIRRLPEEATKPRMPVRQIWVNWDSGSQLALIEGVDEYEVLDEEED